MIIFIDENTMDYEEFIEGDFVPDEMTEGDDYDTERV